MQRASNQHLFFMSIVILLIFLACQSAGTLSPDPTATLPFTIEGLAMALSDPSYAVRFRAAKALRDLGPEASPAVPALAQALSDPRYEMRLFAAEALSEIGPAAASALPEIMAALRSNDRDQEGPHLIITLGNIGTEAGPAVPLLIDILENENDDLTRSLATESLGKIGDPKALPVLVRVLEEERGAIFDVREDVIRTVANFGEHARFTIPLLATLLDDENRNVAELSACTIAKITNEPFIDSEGECSFVSAENEEARIVIAARDWWREEGQFQNWGSP